MNQDTLTRERPATRAPVFFWITVGLLAMLLLGGAAVVLLLAPQAKDINRAGGWGWLLVGGVYVAATTVVCFACALCTAVSLFRREAHRGLSIAILIISFLVVWAFGPKLIRVVSGRRRQHQEVAHMSKGVPRPPADSLPRLTIPIAFEMLVSVSRWDRFAQRPKNAIEQEPAEKRLLEIIGIAQGCIEHTAIFVRVDPGDRLFR